MWIYILNAALGMSPQSNTVLYSACTPTKVLSDQSGFSQAEGTMSQWSSFALSNTTYTSCLKDKHTVAS